VGGAQGYITAGCFDTEHQELGEVFLKLGKQGSTLAGVMDAFSIAVSIGLQYGVPLDTFVQKFTNQRFEPAGLTDDPDVRMAQSVMDYIFRRLALDHLSFESRAALGIYTAQERERQLETGSYSDFDEVDPESASQDVALENGSTKSPAPSQSMARPAGESVHSTADLLDALQGRAADAPICMTCGTKMRPSGSCHVCEGCGATSGCS
jgi:ribonucleoside-diphosphate reductase alpha chain